MLKINEVVTSNKNEKLVTIITVVRNAKEALACTISSVAKNKPEYVEYIVIDGASSDGSVDVIKSQSNIVDLWLSESDTGIYDAMNKGVRVASGRWLYFLNAGDCIRPNMLDAILGEMVVATSLNSDLKIISGRVGIVDEDGISLGYTHPEKMACLPDLIKKNCIAHQATLIRADLFLEYGPYRTNYKIMGDYEYWIRLMKYRVGFHFCNIVVADFVANGVSSNRQNYLLAQRELLSVLVENCYKTRHNALFVYICAAVVFKLKTCVLFLLGKKISGVVRKVRMSRK